MKRTKERTAKKKDSIAFGTFAMVASLMALVTLFVTTWAKYRIQDGEVVSYAHNYIFNVDIPVNYFWVLGVFAVFFVPSIFYILSIVDENRFPGWMGATLLTLSIASFAVGGGVGIASLIGSSVGLGTYKADAILEEYTKDYKSSPSMYIDDSDKADSLDKIINEVKGDGEAEGDFIDSTFDDGNADSGSYAYVYRVIEKNDKYYLVGVKKGSERLKDAIEIGEVTKAQTREIAALTEKKD